MLLELLGHRLHLVSQYRAHNFCIKDCPFVSWDTHNLESITTSIGAEKSYVITILYNEHSDASGALLCFVFITENGVVDFTRSALLALDRNTSFNQTLPFDLYPGHYGVYVYDIECDGTLSNGLQYPAVTDHFIVTGNSFGTYIIIIVQTLRLSSLFQRGCLKWLLRIAPSTSPLA